MPRTCGSPRSTSASPRSWPPCTRTCSTDAGVSVEVSELSSREVISRASRMARCDVVARPGDLHRVPEQAGQRPRCPCRGQLRRRRDPGGQDAASPTRWGSPWPSRPSPRTRTLRASPGSSPMSTGWSRCRTSRRCPRRSRLFSGSAERPDDGPLPAPVSRRSTAPRSRSSSPGCWRLPDEQALSQGAIDVGLVFSSDGGVRHWTWSSSTTTRARRPSTTWSRHCRTARRPLDIAALEALAVTLTTQDLIELNMQGVLSAATQVRWPRNTWSTTDC